MRSNFTGFSGHVNNTYESTLEVAFAVANCLVLLVTLNVGTLANLFVTWAVYRQKSLQTSNNALLVNLAVIDTLRCVIDCPLLLNIALSVRSAKDFGIVFCSAQIASFSLICCVQLFTLACISAERYQAVVRPFKNAERRKRITVSIILTWVVPILISVLCVIFAKDSPVYVRCRGWRVHTLDSYDTFGLYILTPVWSVCLAVIIGFYTRIFVLVRAHGRKIYDKGSFMPAEKKNDKKNQKEEEIKPTIKSYEEKPQGDKFEKESSAGKMASNLEKPLDFAPSENETVRLTTMDKLESVTEKPKETKVTFKDELSNEASNVLDLDGVAKLHSHQENPGETSTSPANDKDDAVVEQNVQDTNENISVTSTNEEEDAELNAYQETAGKTCEGGAETTDNQNPAVELPPSSTNEKSASAHQDTTTETSPASNGDAQITTAPQEEVMGAVCMMPSLAQREKGNTKKESKLAKRSGYIIFTFLIFWIPLIGTVFLNHFFYQNKNQTVEVFRQLEIFTVSVVCMTSFTNPIIYAAVNPQFRTEFYYLKTKWKAFFMGT